MRSLRTAATLGSLALVALACGARPATTLSIDPSPANVNISATAFSTLTVTGTFDGKALLEGAEITLETDNGSFGADGGEQSATATIAGQKATVKLYAPKHPGVANVTATYVDPYAVLVKATTKVTFKTASKPVKLNFSCTARNVGALWDGVGDFSVKCSAVPEDENNELVPGAHVKFLSEAGEFTPNADDPGTWFYRPHDGGRLPKDVPPKGEEPSYVDQTAPGSPTRNPRDGLVTLVAYVEGDSSGIYSTPYLDANDNDSYDAGEDLAAGVTTFEPTQDTYIWKQVKILWTGRTKGGPNATRVVTSDTSAVARGATRTFTWTVLDMNLNVVAANAESDSITWDSPELGVLDKGALALVHSVGIDMDSGYKLRSPTKRETYTRDATYSVTVTNNRAADDIDGDKPISIVGHTAHNLATDEGGVATEEATEELPAATIVLK